MLKKYSAILLLCISNLLLVGHNIVPHDHSIENKQPSVSNHHFLDTHEHQHDHHHHHHHHHDQSDQHEKDSGLGDLFAFMHHAPDYVRHENEEPFFCDSQESINQRSLAELIIRIDSNKDKWTETSSPPFYRDPDYYPPPNSHKGLRAPPVFFS